MKLRGEPASRGRVWREVAQAVGHLRTRAHQPAAAALGVHAPQLEAGRVVELPPVAELMGELELQPRAGVNPQLPATAPVDALTG